MTYTIHCPITGAGLPGSTPDLQHGNRMYAMALQPAYAAGMPGANYDPFSTGSQRLGGHQSLYGKMGMAPVDHPLTRMKGITLDALLPEKAQNRYGSPTAEGYGVPNSFNSLPGMNTLGPQKSATNGYALPVAFLLLYMDNSNQTKH